MRKKVSRLFALLMAVVMLASVAMLSGCGEKEASNGKTKITIWSSDRSEMDVREKQIAEFNAAHDDIEIVYEVKSDGYADLIKVACESNTAPDIFSYVPALAKNGYAKPYDEKLTKKFEEEFLPGAIRRPSLDGKAYAVALKDVGHKFVWNKTVFEKSGLDPEKPPKTWDEVREYAKTITKKGKGVTYGFALPLKQSAFVTYYIMNPSAVDANYNCNGFDPVKGKYSFDCYKPMLEVMRDLKKDGSLFPTPGTLDNDTARAQFAEGNVGMMIGAGWDVGVFNDQFPVKGDWGVTDFPSLDGEVDGGYIFGYGGNAFCMNAKTENEEAQRIVYEWLHSEEILTELSEAGKGPFTMKSISGDKYVPADKKGAKEFATRTEPYVIMDSLQEVPDIKLEGDTVDKVFADAIISDLDFDKCIKDLNKRYNSAFDKFKADEKEEGRDPDRFHMPDYDYSKGY